MNAAAPSQTAAGFAYTAGAYLLWGVLPAYFILVEPTGPVEIVAWRIVLSLVFCAILIAVTRSWARFFALWRQGRIVGWLALASALLTVNWTTFVWAVVNDHVVEAALGYFINPIVTVLLGVLVLRERLRVLQWVAVGISLVAVLVLAIGYGSFPWVALLLAFSFGFYGLVKNRTGGRVDAISGLTIETVILTPVAAGALVWIAATSGLVMGTQGVWHSVALSLAGVVTAVPLLLFAAGARRLPLSMVGLMQYLAPILQFITGAVILAEPMPPARWAGFAIVWVALVVLTVDMVRHTRKTRRGVPDPVDAVPDLT